MVLAQFPLMKDNELEYRVNVGDSQTYEYKRVFQAYLTTPTPTVMTDENGELFNFTIQKGTRIKIIISSMNKSEVNPISGPQTPYMKMEINGRKTQEMDAGTFILPTTDNRTFWEEYVNNTSGNGYIKENIVSFNSGDDQSYFSEIKINIKTGWLFSLYQRESFDNGSLSMEMLLESVSSGGLLDIPISILNSFNPELIGEAIIVIIGGGILVTAIRYKGKSAQSKLIKTRQEINGKSDFIPQAPHTDIIKNIDTLIDELEE
jgi:hypothetical protein